MDIYTSDLSNYCFLGGSSLNTAYFLQNLLDNQNFKIIPIGLVGNDEIGKRIVEKMNNKKFETRCLKRIDGISGKTSIHLDKSGERTIIREKSVNSHLYAHVKELIGPFIDENPMIHMKADLRVAQMILETTDSIFSADISGFLNKKKEEIEEINPKKIFLNKSIEILLGNYQEYLELMDLLVENRNQSELINLENFKENLGLLKNIFNSKWIFVKQGAKGASVFFNNKFIHLDAPIVDVVDTTGAGVIYGVVNNFQDPLAILEIAITTGSLKCTVLGGQEFYNFEELKNKIELIKKKYE